MIFACVSKRIFSILIIQIKKKTLCGKVKEDEIHFQRKRSASLSPDLFKLGIKNNTLDTLKIKEEFLGSTVSNRTNTIVNFFLFSFRSLTNLKPFRIMNQDHE